ncbi:MAG: type II CAAX endopeptidase family protein [Nanoarchaeota archaeon]
MRTAIRQETESGKGQGKILSSKDKILLLVFYFLFVWGMDSMLRKLSSAGISLPGEMGFILYPLAILLLFIIAFLLVKLISKRPFASYGVKRFASKDFTLMLCFVFLLMPLAFLGRVIDPSFDSWYAGSAGLSTFSGFLLFSLVMPLYVIKEEIIERAVFQSTMRRAYGLFIVFFAISLNFSLAHFFYIPGFGLKHVIVQTASVFIGSFFLIMFFELTGNLWLAILLHLVYNVLISLQIYLHVSSLVWESVFWLMMGGLFLLSLRTGLSRIMPSLRSMRISKLPVSEWLFLAVFAVVLPVLLILLR